MKIYLPILLLLPVAVIVFLFLLPFILLVDLLALLFGRFFWLTRLSFRIFEMFFAFRGTVIDVRSKDKDILIKIF